MPTTQGTIDCRQQTFGFQGLGSRKVVADFSGGYLSSDGRVLLLREMEGAQHLDEPLAACLTDRRCPQRVEHELPVLLASACWDWRWATRISTIMRSGGLIHC